MNTFIETVINSEDQINILDSMSQTINNMTMLYEQKIQEDLKFINKENQEFSNFENLLKAGLYGNQNLYNQISNVMSITDQKLFHNLQSLAEWSPNEITALESIKENYLKKEASLEQIEEITDIELDGNKTDFNMNL